MRFSLLILSSALLLFSCSSNSDENSETLSNQELIVNGSPWTFSKYEITEIVDDKGYDLTQTEIDSVTNLENTRFSGQIVTYNPDGTGMTNTGAKFTWIIDNDSIIIPEDNTYIFSVTESELILGPSNDSFEIRVDESTIIGIDIKSRGIYIN